MTLKNNKIPFSEIKKRIYKIVKDEYEVIGEYVNITTKTLFKHNVCGSEFKMSASQFINAGSRCPKCARKIRAEKISLTNDDFIKRVNECWGENTFEILTKYRNAHTKIKVRHIHCKEEYYVSPNNLMRGKGCPYCFGNAPYTTMTFKSKMESLVGKEYSLLSEYIRSSQKVFVIHNICGSEYWVKPNNFIEGKRCPYCSNKISKAEKHIAKFLQNKGVNFATQHSFPNLLYKNKLKFDFAIIVDGSPVLLLEYDGEHHYQEIDYFGGVERLKITQIRDRLKDEFCFKNEIELVRIPYWNYKNLDLILKDLYDYLVNKYDKKIFK